MMPFLRRGLKGHLPLLLFAAAHTLVFLLWFGSGNQVYYEHASFIFQGHPPYRDTVLEYPPLSLVVLLPPMLLAGDTWQYGVWFRYEMLLLDLAALFTIAGLARRLGARPWKALAVYTAGLLAIGSVATQRYDLLPAVLVLWALYSFSRQSYTLSWVALALGAMAKVYPVFLVPLLAIYQLFRRDHRGLAKGAAVFAAITAASLLPWVILSPAGMWQSFQYHASRGLQIESTWASALMVMESLGLTSLEVEYGHGSINLASPLANTLANIATPAVLAALAMVYLLSLRGWRRLQAGDDAESRHRTASSEMLAWETLAILASLVTGRVLSPQFLIWLLPLVALVGGRWLWPLGLLMAAIAALTRYIYPIAYSDLMHLEPLAVGLLAARNGLLVVLGYLVFRYGRRVAVV
jgi:hypothetical protein